ncbi:GNAT family N-acetyltransferase [Chitinivorax sp. B]|uniref:GNAT family N-acetyltransferase n=1 Tax=Chitinivorax sp. B TaxID=2502235 RepID=UPI0010F51FD6|nr:GNAT family N-acetyltransferase [Chitinivorax sp. B]
MSFTIRMANHADAEQIAPLFDAYRQFYGKASDLELSHHYIAERLVNQESVILLAEYVGEAVGFAQLYPTFSSLAATRYFVLYDLYVAPTCRRMGMARTLLTAAADVGRQQGAARLSLSTATTNHNAQALYESLGWVRDREFYYYDLPLVN